MFVCFFFSLLAKYITAIADFDLCLRHRPDTFDAWKLRGNLRYASGDVKGALRDYEAALRFHSSDSAVLNNSALAHAALGEWELSAQKLEVAMKVSEQSPLVLENLRTNIRIIQSLRDTLTLTKPFDPIFMTDPVFEKDADRRMRDVTFKRLMASLQGEVEIIEPPHDPSHWIDDQPSANWSAPIATEWRE